MTIKLNLSNPVNITYYSIPEQIVVNTSDLLKQNELYSIYSGYLRSSPNEKLAIKKYAINDFTNTFIIRELIFLQHLNKYNDSGVIQLLGVSINEQNIYLIFEELGEFITFDKYLTNFKDKSLDNDKIKNIFYNLLLTFNVFHSLGIANSEFTYDNVTVKKYNQGYDIKIYDLTTNKFIGLGPLLSIVSDLESKPNLEKTFSIDKNISYTYDVYSLGLYILRILIDVNLIKFINEQSGGDQNPYLSAILDNSKEKELLNMDNKIRDSNPYVNIYEDNINQKSETVSEKPNPYVNVYEDNINQKSETVSEKPNPYVNVYEDNINQKSETVSEKPNPYVNVYEDNINQKSETVSEKPNPYVNVYEDNINQKSETVSEKPSSFEDNKFLKEENIIVSDQLLYNYNLFVKINDNNELMISDDNNTWSEVSTQIIKNISPDLNNLLIKILQTNLNDRISIKEAIKDKYFNEYSKQPLPEFQGGYYDKTNILNLYKYNYSIEDWTKRQSELSYIEEIHINYKDNVLPKFHDDIGFYKNINDLFKSFKTDEELNILMTSGIDILSNSIIYYRSYNINDKDVDLLKLICVFYSRVFTIDNKFLNGVLESNNYLSKSFQKIILNLQFSIFPIWIHSMYIYIKLTFENKKKDSTLLNFEDTLIESVFEVLLFIMSIQSTDNNISLWEVACYGAIKNLVNKYQIKVEDILMGNIIECLKMPSQKYNIINRIQIETLNYIHNEKFEELMQFFGGNIIQLDSIIDIPNLIISQEPIVDDNTKIIKNDDGSQVVINQVKNDEGVVNVVTNIVSPDGVILESRNEKINNGATESTINKLDENGNIVQLELTVNAEGKVSIKTEDNQLLEATQSVDEETGNKILTYDDGKVEITSDDGSSKIINTDGSEILRESNGDIIKTNTDGTIEKIPLNGPTQIINSQQFDEEGNTIQIMQDGSVVKIYKSGVKEINKDGNIEIINLDGSKVLSRGDDKIKIDMEGNEQVIETSKMNDYGEIERVLSDGTKELEIVKDGQIQVERIDVDGKTETYTKLEKEYGNIEKVFDNRVVTITPDGISTTIDKQTGYIHISLPNGDLETRDKEGNLLSKTDKEGNKILVEGNTTKITDKDGNLSMQTEQISESGNKVLFNSDGHKIEILPNGTKIETKMNQNEMITFVNESDIPLKLIKDEKLQKAMIERSGKKVYKSYTEAYKNCPIEILNDPNIRFTVECLKDVIIE